MASWAPILVGVDGSEQSRIATDWALAEARMRKAPVELLHVRGAYSRYGVPPGSAVASRPQLPEMARTPAARLLDEAVAAARTLAPDVEVTGRMAAGRVAHELVGRSETAQLVVVGARGIGRVARLVLGSVSAHVAAHSRAPVVVTRSQPAATGPVVVGVDGSAVSGNAIAFAFEEASLRRTPLVAVHCWDPGPLPGYDIGIGGDDLREALAEEAELLLSQSLAGWSEKHPDVSLTTVLTPGHPVEQLSRQAVGAQLLVVGSHGRGALSGMVLGSVGTPLLRGAGTCPVAIARG